MNYKYYNPRKAALDTARELLTGALNAAVADGSLPEAPLPEFIVEIPADVKNGDIASNAAMAGARAFHKAPRQIAQAIVDHLNLEGSLFDRVEIAGPGFINLFLGAHWFTSVLQAAATEPEYGRTDGGAGKRYNVEFVSANPTGPMHMGNARGGALGDCLAACLDWAGYDVTREFYINDAGNQIQKFGKSLAIRYLQLYKGEEAVPLPEECYQGADIIARAKEFAEIHGDSYVDKDFEELKDALIADALPKNIAGLQRDLGKYRITYDVWFHESDLHKSGAVDDVIKILMDKGACYKAVGGEYGEFYKKYFVETKENVIFDVGISSEDEEDRFIPIALGGRQWYNIHGKISIILDDTESLTLVYRNRKTGEEEREVVKLHGIPKRPNKTSKFSVEVEFENPHHGAFIIKDVGFGKLFPTTNKIYRKEFDV